MTKPVDYRLLAGIIVASGMADLASERQRSIPAEPQVKTIDLAQRERARAKHREKLLRRLQRRKR